MGDGGDTSIVATVAVTGTVTKLVVGKVTMTVLVAVTVTVEVVVVVVIGAAAVVVERVTPMHEQADAYAEELGQGEA